MYTLEPVQWIYLVLGTINHNNKLHFDLGKTSLRLKGTIFFFSEKDGSPFHQPHKQLWCETSINVCDGVSVHFTNVSGGQIFTRKSFFRLRFYNYIHHVQSLLAKPYLKSSGKVVQSGTQVDDFRTPVENETNLRVWKDGRSIEQEMEGGYNSILEHNDDNSIGWRSCLQK